MELARYGQAFKDRAVASLLPLQSAAVELVAREVSIGAGRWSAGGRTACTRPSWTSGERVAPPHWQHPRRRGASPQATRADRKRIKELERDLLRKDRALAETAALWVLSKKVAAIFSKGENE